MSNNFTVEQQLAIEAPIKNILVSAGAGSGKTTVLTNRVIYLLNNGVNINELLVLTFTRLAAQEMKERIRKALKNNANLKEQEELLEGAYITTFDSYALSLVKKYHYMLGISDSISIVNESALKLEKYQILDELMDELYLSKNDSFIKLIERYCLKSDQEFKDLIYELNDKLDLFIDKDKYLQSYLNDYGEEKTNKIWSLYYNKIRVLIEEIKQLYNDIERSLKSKEDKELFDSFSKALKPLINGKDFDDYAKYIKFDLRDFRKSKNINETFLFNKKKIGLIRDKVMKIIDLEKKEEIIRELNDNIIYEKEIFSIIKEYDKRIKELKYRKEMFEFIDISKMAIKLLEDNESICKQLKQEFKTIMLDEYQDTSDLQELFISYIANDNVYMVGDIKQSIYRFRNANPQIILKKYADYESDNRKGEVINLMKNFRSRHEVLDDINTMFNEIMVQECGGVSYSKGHQFIFGNSEYNQNIFVNQNNSLEIYNYDSKQVKSLSSSEIEAFIIGNDLKTKIKNNYLIYDKEKKVQRKLEYGDVTILLDRKNSFDTYIKVFEYLGIPLSVYKNNDLTFSNELFCINNIFKLIYKYHNNEFDIEFKHAFMSVARSFLFRYDDDTLFDLINGNDYFSNSIYYSLKDIISNYNYLSLLQILDEIIINLDVFYEMRKCRDIEEINAIIHYIIDLIQELNDLEYDLEKVIQYFDTIIKKEFKLELPICKNKMNSTKIMTIHGSKGLEFSVCYYAGYSKKFNEFDSKKKFIYDKKYGLILPVISNNIKYNNIAKYLYIDDYYNEEIGEKIRLLYVALSRAKEKMIVVGDFNGDKKKEALLDCRSFRDLIMYNEEVLEKYYKYLDITKCDLNEKYRYHKESRKISDNNQSKILNKELNISSVSISEDRFSKSENNLMNISTIELLKRGKLLHGILEKIDFKNPSLDKYSIDQENFDIINKFLNCDLIKNANFGKVYKEYEFMYKSENSIKHGFIDLMIEHERYIDIIDYKLYNIEDDAYYKQLDGYRLYIQSITNKKVNIYLYSLLKGEIRRLEEVIL